MSTTDLETKPQAGFCFHCGTTVDGDISDHCQTHAQPTDKPRTEIKSWRNRLSDVVTAIEEIRQGTDIDAQIRKLDQDVIVELYLVRAKLTEQNKQEKRG